MPKQTVAELCAAIKVLERECAALPDNVADDHPIIQMLTRIEDEVWKTPVDSMEDLIAVIKELRRRVARHDDDWYREFDHAIAGAETVDRQRLAGN